MLSEVLHIFWLMGKHSQLRLSPDHGSWFEKMDKWPTDWTKAKPKHQGSCHLNLVFKRRVDAAGKWKTTVPVPLRGVCS